MFENIKFLRKEKEEINWKISNKKYLKEYRDCKKNYIKIYRWIYILKMNETEMKEVIENNIFRILNYLFDDEYYIWTSAILVPSSDKPEHKCPKSIPFL